MLTGLEIFYRSIAKDFKCPNDAMAAIIHYTLVTYGYKCSGNGDKFEETVNPKDVSEMLPNGWNNTGVYVLKYIDQLNDQLLLKVIPSNDEIFVNFQHIAGNYISSTRMSSYNFITENYQHFDYAFKGIDSVEKIHDEIKNEIIDKLKADKSINDLNSSKGSTECSVIEEEPPVRRPDQNFASPLRIRPSYQGYLIEDDMFPQVGGADLDPLGRGIGGGMLFDPRSLENLRGERLPGRRFPDLNPRFDPSSGLDRPLPPGAVPPGARFEHFGPPNRRNNNFSIPKRNHPDMEQFPPDYDDMYM